jgi:hypothetical protein
MPVSWLSDLQPRRPRKTAALQVRVTPEEHRQFEEICNKLDTTMSTEIVGFVRKFIRKNAKFVKAKR